MTSKPSIKLGVDVHRVVDEAVAALALNGDIFSRSGSLVRVMRGVDSPGVKRAEGAATVRVCHAASLLETLTKVARWLRYDVRREEWNATTPPASVIAAVEHRGEWPGVRRLVGIIEAPALRPDGTVIQDPGFDEATGFLYEPSATFPKVPSAPSMADVHRARNELLEVVVDFPFAAEEHRSAWVAFALTLFARPAIEGCVPLMAVDATTRGTGKTRLIDATAMLATGRAATKTPQPQDDEEFRKRITSLIVEGESIACLDNVTIPLAFPSLDTALTGTVWKDRLLSKNATVTAPNRLVWCANGNNLAFGADTARRTLHIRLESPLENPEDRDNFRHGDLLAWVKANRPRLVVAALTILRGYAVAGMPSTVRPWGSFEDWSRVVGGAVVWAGMVDPQSTRVELESTADTTKNALAGIIAGWARLAGDHGLTAKAAISALYPDRHGREAPPDGHDDLRDAIEAVAPPQPGKPPSPSKLGYALRTFRKRVIGGRMLDCIKDRTGIQRWRVVPAERSAGDGDIAGDVSNPSCEVGRNINNVYRGRQSEEPGGEYPQHLPHPLHADSEPDLAEESLGEWLARTAHDGEAE